MLELVNKDNLLHLNAYPWLITQNGRSVENPVKISISSKLLYYPYGEEHGVYFIITFPVILADRVIMEISPEGMEDRRVYLQFSLSNSQKLNSKKGRQNHVTEYIKRMQALDL